MKPAATPGSGRPSTWRLVVVAYDGSTPAARAVSFAMNLASLTHCEIHVVHAIEHPRDVIEPITEEEIRNRQRVDDEVLHRIAEEGRRQGITIRTSLHEGSPAQTVLQVAEEEGPNLIVVGTRGLRGATKILLGSVSSGIIAGSRIPVTVVH